MTLVIASAHSSSKSKKSKHSKHSKHSKPDVAKNDLASNPIQLVKPSMNSQMNQMPNLGFNFNDSLFANNVSFNYLNTPSGKGFAQRSNVAPADKTSTPAAKMPTLGRKSIMLANQKYVEDIAKDINCDSQDLMAVIDIESGWKTNAKNPCSSASGLGQITNDPLKRINKRLGTSYTTTQLRNMSAAEQMPILKEYLIMSKKDANFKSDHKLTGGELYCLFAAPANAKKQYLYKNGTDEYSQNPFWDANKDGYITTADLGKVVEKRSAKISA